MITTFHAGDMGDIVWSIPTIKALSSNILYLDPDGGEKDPLVKWADRTRTKLDLNKINFLKPLLNECGIEVKVWSGEEYDFNLNKFRLHHRFNNLAYAHLQAFNLAHKRADIRWLNCPWELDLEVPEVLISRSCRYHGNFAFWENFLAEHKNAVYVGIEKEHEIFEYTFGKKIKYIRTETIQELTYLIANCKMFASNQGLPNAIAEGLKHPNMICEVFRPYPCVVFKREGVTYV